MRRLYLGIIAGALAVATSTPVWAGDTLCLWTSFPAEARAEVVASYALGGSDAVSQGMKALGPAPGRAACLGDSTTQANDAANAALQGYALERAAATYIQQTLGIAPEKLEAAWKVIPGPVVATLFNANASQEANDDAADAIVAAAVLAGWDPAAAGRDLPVQLGHIVSFITGRALRDLYERQF